MLTVSDAARTVEDRTLWRALGVDLAPQDRLVVTGPSGSGKTLLLRAIAALDPLDAGTCRLFGRTPAEWGVPAYRARVLYVPQRPALPAGTALDALRLPFTLGAHRDKAFDEGRARELLAALGRPDALLATPTEHLSGGESQSVQLARALLLEPNVLLLDEVTAALDAGLARRAEDAVVAWASQGERAVVWVGHDATGWDRVGTRTLDLAEVAA